jgi:hypothetical protein
MAGGAGCVKYLPNTVVEHMHPFAGKAEWTPGHRRVNTTQMYDTDRLAYELFVSSGGLGAAVETVRILVEGHHDGNEASSGT